MASKGIAAETAGDDGFVGFQVFLRCRPLNNREISSNQKCVVSVDTDTNKVFLQDPRAESTSETKTFVFNKVFGPDASQQEFFDASATPIINGVFQGTNGAVFSYGQTGAGKTYAIQGSSEERGLLPRSASAIFDHIGADTSRAYTVSLSFLEIYNENIYDLLNDEAYKTKLRIKQEPSVDFAKVYVDGLTRHVITDVQQCQELVDTAMKRRNIQTTMMSTCSSRSHALAIFKIESAAPGSDEVRSATLSLVDLAGSERQSKTGATGHVLKEGALINRSLTALGNCISALTDTKTRHIPYRDSALTRLLQDSLGGTCNTVMSCHVSPAEWSYDESLSTLRYGTRARMIRNKPKSTAPPPETAAPIPPAPLKLAAAASKLASATQKQSQQSELREEEEWVVVLPQQDAISSVAEVARKLEEEGVASIPPAEFLQRFQRYVGAVGRAEEEWEQV